MDGIADTGDDGPSGAPQWSHRRGPSPSLDPACPQPMPNPETTRIAPPRLIWRLRSASSGQISECQIIDHSPVSFELRIVHIPQGVTVTSSRFTGTEAAMNCATLLATVLCADGCTDESAEQPA